MKTIIFDLGNVLINVDSDKLTNNLIRVSSLSTDKLEYFEKRLHYLFYTGKVSGNDFYEEFNSLSKTKITYDDFKILWSNIFSYNIEMINFVVGLSLNDLRIIIASNTEPIHIEYIKENFPLPFEYSEFLSYDEGFMKPEDGFYQKMINKYSIDLNKAIFFDDLKLNVKYAEKNGIKSYIHLNNKGTFQRINEFIGMIK